jgi:ComF family protein
LLLRHAGALLRAVLEIALPADCLACATPLPWRQEGGVCGACWNGLPWEPRAEARSGALAAWGWALPYRDTPRALVQTLKFDRFDPLGTPLGRIAAARAAPVLERLGASGSVLVPVPIHWTRRLERGFNQADLLARGVARALDREVDGKLLRRVRRGPRQLGLSRRERRRVLRGVFAAGPAARGRRILLIDDVVTTGATLEAGAAALRRAGARSVAAFAICRTPTR